MKGRGEREEDYLMFEDLRSSEGVPVLCHERIKILRLRELKEKVSACIWFYP